MVDGCPWWYHLLLWGAVSIVVWSFRTHSSPAKCIPRARHKPIPVPFHLKEATRLGLMKDVERGIITPVPIGTPTEWCSTMVITVKKDGRPRRTVDYQYLNSQCQRKTHHTSSPFHLALQVPPDTKKTVLEAVDGYHSVPLDAESQPLTTFITEWGRFMYLHMPQGYLASGDAYTRRYDEVIKDVEREVKCVDDVLLYDSGIEEAFYHTFDYLTLCAKNGVVQNRKKFQFCQDTVQFAGLQLTPSGVAPSQSMLSAIQDFPTPQNITDARSWLGLVNQVAWPFSLGPVMQPSRDLVKPCSKFVWDQSLEEAFQQSKAQIIDLVKDGISTFDIERTTCLAPDWSKEGMGFLLLQKYCSCANDKVPTCCSEGWHLVFAGSRFCTPAESRYAPIEGEAAAIAWALHKCRMFVAGCQDLIVTTDHQPLTGVFGDCDLSGITNPRLFKLKEKTLQYRFTIQHSQGKWHRGSDAMSRHPAAVVKAVNDVCCVCPTEVELQEADAVEDAVRSVTMEAMADYGDDLGVISPDLVRAGRADRNYMTLVNTVERGFPGTRHLTDPGIHEFWEVWHRLSTENGLVLIDRRIVIPLSHRKRVLRCLHAAHQGLVGMKARANISVYWPGMDVAIRNHHASCCVCTTIAPCLPQETIVLTPSPFWPFQKICMDMFNVDQVSYDLQPMQLVDNVAVQNNRNRSWDRTGTVVEILPSRQYRIRMVGSGRITRRNRRFIRLLQRTRKPQLTPSASHTLPAVQPAAFQPSASLALPAVQPTAPPPPPPPWRIPCTASCSTCSCPIPYLPWPTPCFVHSFPTCCIAHSCPTCCSAPDTSCCDPSGWKAIYLRIHLWITEHAPQLPAPYSPCPVSPSTLQSTWPKGVCSPDSAQPWGWGEVRGGGRCRVVLLIAALLLQNYACSALVLTVWFA